MTEVIDEYFKNKNDNTEDDSSSFSCDGKHMQKMKFNDFSLESTTYNDNYEMGLINDRIIFEV